MDGGQLMTRRRPASGTQGPDACATRWGLAEMLVATIVAACLLWAVYAASFAYLGAIDQQSHRSIQVGTAGGRR